MVRWRRAPCSSNREASQAISNKDVLRQRETYENSVLHRKVPDACRFPCTEVGNQAQEKDKELLLQTQWLSAFFVGYDEVIDQADKDDEEPDRVDGRWDHVPLRVQTRCGWVQELQKEIRFVPRVSNKNVPVVLLDSVLSNYAELGGKLCGGLRLALLEAGLPCKKWFLRWSCTNLILERALLMESWIWSTLRWLLEGLNLVKLRWRLNDSWARRRWWDISSWSHTQTQTFPSSHFVVAWPVTAEHIKLHRI
jgi:hypothetical protein